MMVLKAVGAMLAIIALTGSGVAQQSIKVLTLTEDTCAAFVAAMDSRDQAKAVGMGGWALGFLSGVAQGTGVDILRGATAGGVTNRLYSVCRDQPGRPMSLVLEEMARSLVIGHH
jgi:hypothetical protein